MASSRRERLHEATREEIKSIARQQMDAQGTAAISMRGIAAQMGMSTPFLYHYYHNRDELVTALIVDAYTLLAESLEQADASCPSQDIADRTLAVLLAYREWAVTHPTDFALILGNPIPGYRAPEDIILPAARRGLLVMLHLARLAWQQQRLHIPSEYQDDSLDLTQEFTSWCQQQGYEFPIPVLFLVLTASAMIQGLISLEIYGHTQFFLRDPSLSYRSEMLALLRRWGMITRNI